MRSHGIEVGADGVLTPGQEEGAGLREYLEKVINHEKILVYACNKFMIRI